MQIRKGGRHSYTFTKGPLHTVSLPLGCARTCTLPLWNLTWAPALAATHVFGPRASLSGSLILLPPILDLSYAGHWGLGVHGACSPCPHISTASQGSAQLPYTDLALHIFLLPMVGCRLAQGPALGMSHMHHSSIRPSVLSPMGPGSATSFSEREGKGLGLMGKAFYKWHQ